MSVAYVLKSGALAACLTCLLVPVAQGQQQQLRQNQLGQRPTERQAEGQFGRQATQGNEANNEVDQFLAKCLLAKNKAEMEISEIAAQEASDPQVKQFAQKMVQDHRDIVQKLEQIAGSQMTSQRQQQPGGLGSQQLQQRQSQQQGQPGQAQRNNQPGQSQPGQSLTDRSPGRSGQSGSEDQNLQKIAQIDQQITQKATDAVTQKLREKSGSEFDQAYLGCAVGAHTQMKAALDVISQQTSGQLAQLAEQTQQKVEQHLQEAERLMKQTEDGARQAQRPQQGQRE